MCISGGRSGVALGTVLALLTSLAGPTRAAEDPPVPPTEPAAVCEEGAAVVPGLTPEVVPEVVPAVSVEASDASATVAPVPVLSSEDAELVMHLEMLLMLELLMSYDLLDGEEP